MRSTPPEPPPPPLRGDEQRDWTPTPTDAWLQGYLAGQQAIGGQQPMPPPYSSEPQGYGYEGGVAAADDKWLSHDEGYSGEGWQYDASLWHQQGWHAQFSDAPQQWHHTGEQWLGPEHFADANANDNNPPEDAHIERELADAHSSAVAAWLLDGDMSEEDPDDLDEIEFPTSVQVDFLRPDPPGEDTGVEDGPFVIHLMPDGEMAETVLELRKRMMAQRPIPGLPEQKQSRDGAWNEIVRPRTYRLEVFRPKVGETGKSEVPDDEADLRKILQKVAKGKVTLQATVQPNCPSPWCSRAPCQWGADCNRGNNRCQFCHCLIPRSDTAPSRHGTGRAVRRLPLPGQRPDGAGAAPTGMAFNFQ